MQCGVSRTKEMPLPCLIYLHAISLVPRQVLGGGLVRARSAAAVGARQPGRVRPKPHPQCDHFMRSLHAITSYESRSFSSERLGSCRKLIRERGFGRWAARRRWLREREAGFIARRHLGTQLAADSRAPPAQGSSCRKIAGRRAAISAELAEATADHYAAVGHYGRRARPLAPLAYPAAPPSPATPPTRLPPRTLPPPAPAASPVEWGLRFPADSRCPPPGPW